MLIIKGTSAMTILQFVHYFRQHSLPFFKIRCNLKNLFVTSSITNNHIEVCLITGSSDRAVTVKGFMAVITKI